MAAFRGLIISNRLLARTVVAADSVLPALPSYDFIAYGWALPVVSAQIYNGCVDILSTCDISRHFRTTSIASYALSLRPEHVIKSIAISFQGCSRST